MENRTGPTHSHTLDLPSSAFSKLLSPALVVDLGRVRKNVSIMLDLMAGDVSRWRPHLKTTKLPIVWRELLTAPPNGLRQFKCATTKEARVLLETAESVSAPDIDLLIAYPLCGPGLHRAASLAAQHTRARMSILTECAEHVRSVPAPLSVFIDVNPGMDRTGISLEATDEVLDLAAVAGDRFRGFHFYDGHIRSGSAEQRQNAAHDGYRRLVSLVDRALQRGLRVEEIITSGTTTFAAALSFAEFVSDRPTRHTVSPGTVVFSDTSTAELEELSFEYAAVVLSRVISAPLEGIVTCDAGSKSIAAEAGDPCAVALGHANLRARKPSEEHLPFDVTGGAAPPRGTILQLAPRHVCPTVNLADEAVIVDAGHVVDVVPIDARGHDLR